MNGGISFGDGTQVAGDVVAGDKVSDGAVKGDGNTVTNTFHNGGPDPWAEVDDVCADADDEAKAAVGLLKAEAEKPEDEQDGNAITSALDAIRPYSPIVRAFSVAAIELLPGGVIIKTLAKSALTLAK